MQPTNDIDGVAALKSYVAADRALSAIEARVCPRLGDDPGHDLAHARRVALWTLRLGGAAVDRREAVAAALLHDVVNLPKDHPERHLASERSAELARVWLAELGFEPEAVERVAGAVRDHSFSRGAVPETALGAALQDADRLEALGAIGIMRTFATGVRMGAVFFDAEDPWAEARPLDDRRCSLDHFFTKLLGLAATMRTEAGRREAERRAEVMHRFLDAVGEELGAPRPEAARAGDGKP
jgi:uncharacterized protein